MSHGDPAIPARLLSRAAMEAALAAEWHRRTAAVNASVHEIISKPHRLSPANEWLVDIELRCPRCENVGRARFALPTFVEFDKQMKEGAIHCECGGAFGSKESKVILL